MMRGFLECYGFRPNPDYVMTCDEMMDDDSEDVMDVLELDDDYLAALDDAAWEEYKAEVEAEYNGEDQGDWTAVHERAW